MQKLLTINFLTNKTNQDNLTFAMSNFVLRIEKMDKMFTSSIAVTSITTTPTKNGDEGHISLSINLSDKTELDGIVQAIASEVGAVADKYKMNVGV